MRPKRDQPHAIWLTALAGAALALLVLTASAPTATAGVTAVHIVSSVAGEDATDTDATDFTDAPKRARLDQAVTLYAVLETTDGGRTRYYSSASRFRLGNRERTAQPLAAAPTHFIVWEKVEPAAESMSNTASGKFRFESIEYVETVMLAELGKGSIAADVRPVATTDRGDGVGTMRFKVSVTSADGLISSPGKDARAGRGSGGLAASVHRITIRRDDSYLGFLTELYGQPYIWASAGRTDKSHQSETLEGSDCADFVVYGRRRTGGKVPYTWTGGLPEHTALLARGEADKDGIYRDRDGKSIPFPKVGDLVLFPRHVGAITQDRGEIGVLDHADIMMHSYFASPREQSLGDSDYASTWLEVRRFK